MNSPLWTDFVKLTSDLAVRSEPARSTSVSYDVVTTPAPASGVIRIRSSMWLRLEELFNAVADVARVAIPWSSAA